MEQEEIPSPSPTPCVTRRNKNQHTLYQTTAPNMVTHHRHLSALSPTELATLAALLTLPPRLLDSTTGAPSDLWLATQARQLKGLPKPLRRPSNWLSRLSIATNRTLHLTLDDLVPQCAVLCHAHAELNPWIVRRVFFLLSDEVSQKLETLKRVLARPGRYKASSDAVVELRGLVERLNEVLSLWMPGCWSERFPRMASGCEACVVAAVGAQTGVLVDLRAVLVGRTHCGRRQPALLNMVEAWIGQLEREEAVDIERESERLARAVKRARKAVQERRKKGRKGHSRKYVDDGEQHPASLSTLPRESPATTAPLDGGYVDGGNTVRTAAIAGDFRRPANSTAVDTIDDIIDAYGADEDFNDEEEALDEEYDETDPRTAQYLQDSSRKWYSTHSEVSEQHPAFRWSAADIEAHWAARRRVAMSALPSPLRVSSNSNDDDSVDERFDPSQWTDVSMHTSANGVVTADHKHLVLSEPSRCHIAFVLSDNGSIILAEPEDRHYAAAPSSLYSHDGDARPHPSPPRSDLYFEPPISPEVDVFPRSGSSRVSSRFTKPHAVPSPPVPEPYYHEQAPSMVTSQVTSWPGPDASRKILSNLTPDVYRDAGGHHSYQLTTSSRTPSSSRHRHTSSSGSVRTANTSATHNTSDSSLSPAEFQSALDRFSLNDSRNSSQADSTFDPEGTVLPNESISVVAAIQADEEYARALQRSYERPPGRMGFRSEDGVEIGDDDSVRAALERSRGPALQEQNRRRKEM